MGQNIRRVDGSKLFARLGRHKLVIDIESNGLGIGASIRGCQLHGQVRHNGGAVESKSRGTRRGTGRTYVESAQRPNKGNPKHCQGWRGEDSKGLESPRFDNDSTAHRSGALTLRGQWRELKNSLLSWLAVNAALWLIPSFHLRNLRTLESTSRAACQLQIQVNTTTTENLYFRGTFSLNATPRVNTSQGK